MVGALIVHAVNDLVPYPIPKETDLEQKDPFMYWVRKKGLP
jgi:hypothetical protein